MGSKNVKSLLIKSRLRQFSPRGIVYLANKRWFFPDGQQGISLLETLVAIAILSIIALIIVLALTQGFTFWSVGEKEAVVQNEIEKALSQMVDGDAEGRFGIRGARSIDNASNMTQIIFYDEDNVPVKYDRDAAQRLRRTQDGNVEILTSSDVKVSNLEFHYFGAGDYPDPPTPTPTPAEVSSSSASLVKVKIEVKHAREESGSMQLTSAAYCRYARMGPPPLIISDVRVRGNSLGNATVSWMTNKPADSRVNYDVTTGLGSTVYDSTPVTEHSITISLSQEARYYYEVRSTTAGGETAVAGIYSFRLYTPTAVIILPGGGTPGGGNAADLRVSDNNYYQVNSTSTSPFTTDWQATISNVETPWSAVQLAINFEGNWKGKGNQPPTRDLVLYVWNFSDSNWEEISLTPLEDKKDVLITPLPIDGPADYISSGGEVRVRVYMAGVDKEFSSAGDLMLITVEYR